ncbi:MAG: dihydropteroate synthase [Pseudomonadota bacterium]
MDRESPVAYLRPVPCAPELPGAWRLAGTALGVREVAVIERGRAPEILPIEAAAALPGHDAAIGRLCGARPALPGLQVMDLRRPAVMGIVNVTPDSFSDGGLYADAERAVAHGLALAAAGADILDIGGESTRPGAQPVSPAEEQARVLPVIEGLRAAGCTLPLSIDTRNASTAHAALGAGATLLNDVSAMLHDPEMPQVAATAPALCLMHAQGDPQTMQANPHYEDVLLDVYDFLEARLSAAEALGVPRERILVDPGIGFGKTVAHNLALIRGLSLLHSLGAPLLLGLSRKRFIGTIGGGEAAAARMPGSLGAGIFALNQGVHVLRVHDVAETVQAVRLWHALADPAMAGYG